MKVLLLAAGRGTRISRYLGGNPKCTVDLTNNEKLIQYTLRNFNELGVTDIALSLGYNPQPIKNALKDFNVKYFYNPFYDVTNSIASCWFAKEFLSDYEDTWIMNADVFMEQDMFKRMLDCPKSPVMFADSRRGEEGDFKFKYNNGYLEKYGKELTGSDISGEYIGVAKFSKDFMPYFVNQMEEMINHQEHSVWWENILYHNLANVPVQVEEINDLFWAEVDYIEDYNRILEFCKE